MSSLPLLGVMTVQSRTRSNKRQAQTSATTINVAKEQTYGEDAKPTHQVTRTSDGQRITLPGQSNVTSLTSHPELRSDQTDNLNNTVSAVFGRNVFSSQGLTFEPNENMATPQNYRLGPNDEVLIDIWGESEDHISQVITPEGSIMISQIGPVYLSGMTISEANNHIKSLFAKKYAGVGETTDINVTLGEIRSIQVDVMGEVATPGTYRLSPFSSVFHALYNAGGINDIGSLRNITVMRNGKNIGNIDVYDYLFKGRPSKNIRLQEGDVILVPTYNELVTINGNVKRPMRYELKTTETIDDLIKYAGGYTGDAYSGMVRLNRQNGAEKELFNVEKSQFSRYRLQDGDVVSVGTVLDEFNNRVNISGAVMRPDFYALGSDVKTLTQLIKAADGLTEDAFTDRMLIYREGPDLTVETISVNYNDILNGSAKDISRKTMW